MDYELAIVRKILLKNDLEANDNVVKLYAIAAGAIVCNGLENCEYQGFDETALTERVEYYHDTSPNS
jgi:flagellar basal body P-ring protein FlgI